MEKLFYILSFLLLGFNGFSQSKYYYNYYIGPEGTFFVEAIKDSASLYSDKDLDTITYGGINVYYKTGDLFAKDFYDFRTLTSSKHFYRNGKKMYTSSTGTKQSALDVNSDMMKVHYVSHMRSIDNSWDSLGTKKVSGGTGYFIGYYPNGMVMHEGAYEKGFPVDTWKTYYENGKLMYEGYYSSNYHGWKMETIVSRSGDTLIKSGTGKFTLFYPNGKPSFMGEFVFGRLSNVFRAFYPNGQLRYSCYFLGGNNHGKYESFYSTGIMSCSGNYNNGAKKGEWKWFDKKGKLKDFKKYDFLNNDVR